MAIPLFVLGATIIRTAAPAIIKALTKQGAKKIAKPSAKQIKNAVSPKNAPKKIQDAIKPKPTGTAARKARRNKTGDSTSKTPADAARKKQTDQLKQGNGARKAQPPKKPAAKKPAAKKPTTAKKPDPKKDSGMSTGAKIIGGGTLVTGLGAETIRQANKDKKEGMGGKATVSPNQKSRQATLPKEEGIGTKIARALGDKRSEEEMIRTRKMNEEDEKEMGMNKGGAVKKKYGMREGGFTKRGGMYKKGY